MAGTIRLTIPVFIDGEEVSELSYDADKIGTNQFMEAEARSAAKAAEIGQLVPKVAELDTGFHFYLGIMAVIAANPGYTVEDVERVKGPDLVKIMRVGRNFMTAGAEEDEGEDSDEPESPDYADEGIESYLPEQD